jgi:hypothetical protein
MADISEPPITDIKSLKVGVEYEGRPQNVSFPLVRGTFKKIITEDGDKLAVFDPIFMGSDEYHLVKYEGNPEDVAIIGGGLYHYFPLLPEATKKFERNLKGFLQHREKRQAVRGIRGSELPPDVTDKIAEMLTGVRHKPVMMKKKKGGRRFTRKQCKKFTCAKMGFTQKASCRPYKNCYESRKSRR